MVVIQILGSMFLMYATLVCGSAVPESIASGYCYPSIPSACDQITSDTVPKSVYLLDIPGLTPTETLQAREKDMLQYLDLISSLPVPSSCIQPLLELVCFTTYAECAEITLESGSIFDMPTLLDRSACVKVWDVCDVLFVAAEKAGFAIFGCEDTFPSSLLSAWSSSYLDGPEITTKGTPIFPDGSYQYNVSYNHTWQLIAVETYLPGTLNTTRACAELVCDSSGYYQKQDCRCVFDPSCPFPVYQDAQYNSAWAAVVALGVIALPFNLAIVLRGKKLMETLPYIPIAAALALLYNALHTFVVAGEKYNISCGTKNDFNDFSGISNIIFSSQNESDVNGWCQADKSTIFILQSILNASVCAMYNVFIAVNDARHNKVTAPQKDKHRLMTTHEKNMYYIRKIFVFMYIFGLPLICMVTSYGLGDTFGTDLDTGNDVRFAFMCRPRYATLAIEFVLVHALIIFSGLLLLFLCYMIAISSYLLHRKMENNPIFKRTPSQLKLPKSKLKNLKQNKKKMNTAISLAKRTMVFGGFASFFLFAVCFLFSVLLLYCFILRLM
jgi:hypothetical protein